MSRADKPFRLRGGKNETAAIHNRISAIERINYLVGGGFDLRKKGDYFLMLLDIEMYERWYKNEPKEKPVDEDWCQRAAEVIRIMELDVIANNPDAYKEIRSRTDAMYKEYLSSIDRVTETEKKDKSFIKVREYVNNRRPKWLRLKHQSS
jgi:hypothetical protein